MNASIALLPGDGIGPEVVAWGRQALEAVGHRFGHEFGFAEGIIGGGAIDATGAALPAATLDLCRRSDAVLLGAVGGPKWDDPRAPVRPEQGLLGLRQGLQVFANLRPVRVHPQLVHGSSIKAEVLEGVDLVVVRELTGGIYFGRPSRQWPASGRQGRRVVDTLRYSEAEIERILRFGFELARSRRGLLTSVDKANILESSRLWRQIAQELAPQYSDVRLEHLLVDACAMHLIRRPASFDVIVTENLFGDILTDEAAMLAGSMGMLPSASLGAAASATGSRPGLYEPIHGSAPDIAGQDRANPLATILTTALLLRYSLGLEEEAAAVEAAVDAVLAAGYRTPDIAEEGTRTVGTREMGEAVVERLQDPSSARQEEARVAVRARP